MDERVVQFRVGVMVLATVIITAILVLSFGELPSLVHGTYTIHVTFSEAPGVRKHTPVRKSGIRIGEVTNVQLNPDRTVTVTVRIEEKWNLYDDEECWIYSDLLGDAWIEIHRAAEKERGWRLGTGGEGRGAADQGPGARDEGQGARDQGRVFCAGAPSPQSPAPSPQSQVPHKKLEDGAEMVGKVKSEPTKLVTDLMGDLKSDMSNLIESVQEASDAFAGASSELEEAARRVKELLDDETQTSIRNAAAQATKSLEAINGVIGDKETQQKLQTAMKELPATLKVLKDTINKAGDRLDELGDFTGPLGAGGQQRVREIDEAVRNLNRLAKDLSAFSRSLTDGRGSLGQLVRNPELYQHLNRAAANVEELTRQLKPIVRDARVFSDKIARHPEMLGVRGALQRRAGIK